MGARSAGNPHAACDVEGTGNVARSSGLPARQPSTLPVGAGGGRPPPATRCSGVKFLGPTRQKSTSGNDCFWRILLQKSEIEQSLKSRGSRFLVGSAAATLSRIDTTVCGRFCVRRFGPSRRHVRNASAVLKNFVRHPKKTFSTLLAQSDHSSILTDNEFMQSFEPKPRGAPLDAHGNGPRCAQISGPTVGARERSAPSISWWQTRAG